jgi:hypothetical protein
MLTDVSRAATLRRTYRRWYVSYTEAHTAPDGTKLADNQVPVEWHPVLAEIAAEAVYHAAMLAGEPLEAARMFADEPRAEVNPYSLDRIAVACGMFPEKGAFYWMYPSGRTSPRGLEMR